MWQNFNNPFQKFVESRYTYRKIDEKNFVNSKPSKRITTFIRRIWSRV